jgi:hypothetical protein
MSMSLTSCIHNFFVWYIYVYGNDPHLQCVRDMYRIICTPEDKFTHRVRNRLYVSCLRFLLRKYNTTY